MDCEITWTLGNLKELNIQGLQPINLFCDNKAAAIHITANLVYHENTKHIQIDCHITREKFDKELWKQIMFRPNINLLIY